MLDYSFSEEQQMYRQQVRRFAREEVLPRRQEWDRNRTYPWELVQRFVALGLADPSMDHVTRGIMVEEVAYADFNTAFPVLRASLPYALDQFPGVPDNIRQPLIDGLSQGTKLTGLCFTEPEAGSDMANFRTFATREQETWLINGSKNSISWCNSDAYVVTCKTSHDKSVWSLTNILIPADSPGVSPPHVWDDVGTRGTPRGMVNFDNVRVPLNHAVGAEGRGYELVADLFDTNRSFIGLWCIGPAQASVDEACEHAKQRHSLGKTISQYQGVSFALAEAQTLLEAARLLCYKTLWMADNGQRHSVEGAMCKWWVPDITFDIVHRCLLIHGHYGYTRDLPFEQRMRDIMGWQIGDGTAEVSKLIIARNMMGKDFTG
ncbi:MAG: acyl-CoA dehydrogenase family protein [Dehalococcoidia bacterium]|jgi:cyclohexanecarboxyl-CoA dehydrogenase|nr:acyl-CoA dehydrogenase family protein [Dehalococcoidia bacterium]MDP7239824.1 acyl-CoA dehydrogenase family protein [Dehalococcoidia bacterium]